jgi:four helix bundle protein
VTDVTAASEQEGLICWAEDYNMSGTYKDLEAWQCAMALVLEIYRSTAKFPREEMFGLTSQLRRAAVSVASNIAEGKGRFSDRELSQFLAVARGSVFEIETQIAIASGLGLVAKPQSQELLKRCGEVGRLLNGLIRSVRKPAA